MYGQIRNISDSKHNYRRFFNSSLRITKKGNFNDCELSLYNEIGNIDAFNRIKQKLANGTYELWNSAGSHLVTYTYKNYKKELIIEVICGTAKNSKQAIFNFKEIADYLKAKLIVRSERKGLTYLYKRAGFLVEKIANSQWQGVYYGV